MVYCTAAAFVTEYINASGILLLPFCRRNTSSAASSSPDLSVQNRIDFAVQFLKDQILSSTQEENRKKKNQAKNIKKLFKWKMVLTVGMFFAV